MKKFFTFFLCVAATLTSASFFSSCGSDDDDEPKIPLSVSPSNITLQSDRNSSTGFTINCSKDWYLTNDADWLMTSASSGTGTTPITLTALTDNDSSTPRTATIIITSNGESATVNVTQLAAYSRGNSVDFSNPFVMCNSVAFTYSIGSDVSYFYAGYLNSSSVAWTDDRIVNELTNSDRFDPNDTEATGLTGFGGMDPGTTYYLCAVAYDKKGNRGELTKTKITTLQANVNDPWVDYEKVTYSAEGWYFYMHKNPFTHQYYIVVMDGPYSSSWYYDYTDAEIASMMKQLIDSSSLFPFTNDSDALPYTRTPGATDVYSAVWGESGQFKLSSQLNNDYWTISSDGKPARKVGKDNNMKRINFTPAYKVEEMKRNVKIRKL